MISYFWPGSKTDAAPAVTKAHLPAGSSFYYDNDLKKWVNKNAVASSTAEVMQAPPPKAASSSVANRPLTYDESRPPLSISTNAIAAPVLAQHNRPAAKRGARSRYVDILNPNASAEQTAPAFTTFVPSFASSGGVGTPTIFVPKQSDGPSLYSIMLEDDRLAEMKRMDEAASELKGAGAGNSIHLGQAFTGAKIAEEKEIMQPVTFHSANSNSKVNVDDIHCTNSVSHYTKQDIVSLTSADRTSQSTMLNTNVIKSGKDSLEDEDMGFGNSSLKKAKHSISSQPEEKVVASIKLLM